MNDSIGGFHVWSDNLGTVASICHVDLGTGNGNVEFLSSPRVDASFFNLAGLQLILDDQALDEAGLHLLTLEELLPVGLLHLAEGIVGGGEEGERSIFKIKLNLFLSGHNYFKGSL